MKPYQSLFLVFIATMTIMAACKKENTVQNELSKLPAATQTGANTFGCLVNGKAWVALNKDCSILCDPAFRMDYDGSRGGHLSIDAIFLNSVQNINQGIGIGFDSTNFKTSFKYTDIGMASHLGFYFLNKNLSNDCKEIKTMLPNTMTSGTVILTKYDLRTGIVSGTFEFTLTKSGCETITVTNGRFDKKL